MYPRSGCTRPVSAGRVSAAKKHKITMKTSAQRPPWNDTTNDLTVFRASKDELQRKRQLRRPRPIESDPALGDRYLSGAPDSYRMMQADKESASRKQCRAVLSDENTQLGKYTLPAEAIDMSQPQRSPRITYTTNKEAEILARDARIASPDAYSMANVANDAMHKIDYGHQGSDSIYPQQPAYQNRIYEEPPAQLKVSAVPQTPERHKPLLSSSELMNTIVMKIRELTEQTSYLKTVIDKQQNEIFELRESEAASRRREQEYKNTIAELRTHMESLQAEMAGLKTSFDSKLKDVRALKSDLTEMAEFSGLNKLMAELRDMDK